MIDLRLLRTFLAVYRARSMSVAARALRLTQPAVSQHIGALETTLGEKLFLRSKSGVEPTAHAHDLHARIETHVDALDAAVAPRDKERKGGLLTLGAPRDLLEAFVIPSLLRLPQSDVERRIRITCSDSRDMLRRLLRGELDAVITGDFPSSSIDSFALGKDERILVVGSKRAAQLAGVEPARALRTLAKGPFAAASSEMQNIRELFATHGVDVFGGASFVVPEVRSIAAVVAETMHVSVLPRRLVESWLGNGSLVEIDAGGPPLVAEIRLAVRRGDKDRPWALALRDALVDREKPKRRRS